MTPVRCLDKISIWEQVDDSGKPKYAPVKGNTPMNPNKIYFKGNMQELKNAGHTILLETTYDDFISALKSSKPSVSTNDLSRYIEFTKTFGMDG